MVGPAGNTDDSPDDKPRTGDQQTCRKCASARRNKQPAARADGNHDEDHFESFEDHGLEAGERGEPVEPGLVAACSVAQFRRFGCEGQSFIMERGDARCAQVCLSQPAHAEQQQQNPNRELKEMQRDKIEQRAKQQHDEDQQHKAGERAKPCRTPAANSSVYDMCGNQRRDSPRSARNYRVV